MNIIPKKILQEVVLSTKQNVWLFGNSIDYLLPEYINFGNRDIKVGVKNIRFPQKKTYIKVKMLVNFFLDTVNESQIKEVDLSFSCYEDLCQQLETFAFGFLSIDTGGSLDFRSRLHNESGASKFILSFKFENERIVLTKNTNYVVYIDDHLNTLLQFNEAKKVHFNGEVFWKLELFMHASNLLNYVKKENEIINVAIFDLIESCTLAVDGSKYPILCTFKNNKKNRTPYEYVSIKSVATQFLKRVKCSFFNEYFEPYDFTGFDLECNPLIFTLSFFEI